MEGLDTWVDLNAADLTAEVTGRIHVGACLRAAPASADAAWLLDVT